MELTKPLRRWGNAYGLLVTREEARRLGLHEGDAVKLDLHKGRTMAVDDLPTVRLGRTIDLDHELDEAIYEDYIESLERRRGDD